MRPSSQLVRNIEDVQTELLIQSFADRILVLITQVGKVGNLIQASIPPTAPLLSSSNQFPAAWGEISEIDQTLPLPPPSIQLTPLLGSAPTEHIHTLHSLYVSQVAILVWLWMEKQGEERKPVVLGIALQKNNQGEEKERKTFMGVMQMLGELLRQ
ncbi:hypothetical protein K439DRAFT_1412392 [Ramaria rubella]|nr:hypothetical protein K439DRAFT_1412392 [Ramaria rubella]